MKNEKCIDSCNSLLAGERSAVEAYEIAIDKFKDTPQVSELRRMKDEHSNSVAQLESSIKAMGGEPESDSGAWGVFVKGIQHSANFFGEESALSCLQQGEEHGQNEYREALENDCVEIGCKQLIKDELLPRVDHHILTLERLEEQVD